MLAKKLAVSRFNNQGDPFKKEEFPLLSQIAIDVVAQNIHLKEIYSNLSILPTEPMNIPNQIIEKITTNLPITTSAPNIDQESFWKRSCEDRWKNSQKPINIEEHGRSWKVAYLERHIEEYLQGLTKWDESEKTKFIRPELKAACSWVHTLSLTNMNISLDMDYISRQLPILTQLTITYGMKNATLETYNRQALGMKLSDAHNLGEAIKNSFNLLSLSLPGNMIDDDLLRFIMAGVNMNISLLELNLSHNKIGDQGARRIAKYLMRNEILMYLDLSNNQIQYDGSRFIAQALKVNKQLQNLNLRLNSFNDKAGMKFFKDLMLNKDIVELDISGNQLGYQTALKLADYLSDKTCNLKQLNIGNNNFADDCFEILKTGLKNNISLQKIDIRGCKFKKQKDNEGKVKNPYSLSDAEKELTEIILFQHSKKEKINFYSLDQLQVIKQQQQSQIKSSQQPTVDQTKQIEQEMNKNMQKLEEIQSKLNKDTK